MVVVMMKWDSTYKLLDTGPNRLSNVGVNILMQDFCLLLGKKGRCGNSCFAVYVTSFNPHNNPARQVPLLSSFDRCCNSNGGVMPPVQGRQRSQYPSIRYAQLQSFQAVLYQNAFRCYSLMDIFQVGEENSGI